MSDILSKIKKCDENKPYIFISYSSMDDELIYRDVLEFQKRGYNVWLDEKNLDKRKPSWKEDAISAIERYECKLVVYYVSNNSLVSEACLNEMKATTSKNACRFHGRKPVPFLAVEVEEIDDLVTYGDKVFEEIQNNGGTTEEKQKKVTTLYDFIDDFFSGNNERVRVKPDSNQRKLPYYEDILAMFPNVTQTELPEEATEETPKNVASIPMEPPKTEPVAVQAPVKAEKIEVVTETKQEAPVIQETLAEESTKKKKHVAVNVKIGGVIPEIKSYPANITRAMTLSAFAALFEDVNFALHMRYLRNNADFSKQFLDYVIAALLRGCDKKAEDHSARWNYCTYAVAKNVDVNNPTLGASQFTWQSNSRKVVEIEGAGRLGPNSVIFENLSANLTLGDVEQMFKDRKEGFDTKDNSVIEKVFAALYDIK